ncbi:MAG: tRNA (adenosine(37)-N6)-dimethylallyltransferase MiaA [Rhodobacterales bacterium]|nr:tRNA (adenosine(37)-N6)-dimethylallyltransferase MiaA [Rhodobacterales bacterium]
MSENRGRINRPRMRASSGGDMRGLSAERPVLIAGPTASGKSALAAEIAATQGGVIVNADALQVYGCWHILTARPTVADEAALPHALYGHVPCDADWSVGHWLRAVAGLIGGGQRLILVGGTGLYLSALTEGLADIPPTPPEVRAEADAILRDGGLEALIAGVDAATLARIDRANPARVQRAWEVRRTTGRGLADWQARTGPPLLARAQLQPLLFDCDRDWLADRIDRRFLAMMDQGALDEVRANLPGWTPTHPSARAIGAAELVAHLRGQLPLDQAIARAQAATRQYAKRQRTWFRARMGDWPRIARP